MARWRNFLAGTTAKAVGGRDDTCDALSRPRALLGDPVSCENSPALQCFQALRTWCIFTERCPASDGVFQAKLRVMRTWFSTCRAYIPAGVALSDHPRGNRSGFQQPPLPAHLCCCHVHCRAIGSAKRRANCRDNGAAGLSGRGVCGSGPVFAP